ncbi:MAG: SurA N-terminal domain-containing protein [Clostridia bacterium]|nr:SurA N-terminal domain-containing protein [Clostridia bacterium]
MKKASLMIRILAVILLIALLPLALFSCAAETVSAKKVVGEVDGVKIRYDELYFLIKTYESALAEKYEGDAEGLAKALDDLATEELISNVAMLRLCEAHGLEYKESDLEEAVDKELETMLLSDFDGDEEAFRASMKEVGLTERYLRYTLGVDILYDRLMTVYPEDGLVVSSEKELKTYMMENFIHVYHIALFNDTEEEDAENLQKMTEARRKLLSGSVTMYDLIHGSKGSGVDKILLKGYNEDTSDLSNNGHYLTRGTWEKSYEDAAFDLKIGDFSEVIKVEKTSRSVPGYYVIQRVPMDEDYVDEHLSELQEEYYASVIYTDLLETREDLSFTPNDFYESLDLTDLLPPREGANTLVVVLCIVGGVVLVGGAVTAFVIVKKKKH